MLHLVNPKQNHVASGRPGVEDVGHAFVIDFKVECLAYRTGVQQVTGPVGAAKIHLMQRT